MPIKNASESRCSQWNEKTTLTINKDHENYAVCKCGHEQLNTSTIDQCNKCKEFFTLKYPNRKTGYSDTVKKYVKE